MSQDESKFDTMRLIEGAEGSDLYSLEDIVREFSDPQPEQKPEKPQAAELSEEAAAAAEIDPAASETQAEAETAEEPLLGEELPPPAYESLSESEMADAIAQAVAHTYGADAAQPTQHAQEAPQPETPEPPADQKMPEPEPEKTAPEPPKAAPQSAPQEKPRSAQAKPAAQPVPEKKPEPQAKPGGAGKAAQPREAAPKAQNPGTKHVKIPKGKVPVEAAEYIGGMLTDIRRRQAQALPKAGTSLRATEKRLAALTGMERLLSPVRYVILVLMLLLIGGRSIAWMTLGFMTGKTAILVALVAAITAMLLCWQSVFRAVRDLWYLQPSYETFLLLTTILTMVEALMTQNENTLLPLLTIAWCLTGTAKLMHDQANLRSLRAVITGRGRVGVRTSPDKWDHMDVIGKAPVTTAGFVRYQAQPDIWHRGMTVFLPVLTLICLVAAAYLSAKTETGYLTVLVNLLDIAAPVSLGLCCARPYSLLSQALRGSGAVAGWKGMEELYGKKAMLIYDSDLFPEGTIRQMGVRAYGPMDARTLVSYGATMALRANVGLRSVFTKLLRDMNGEIYDVDRFQIQETGLEGYIQGNLVHLGSYQYMQLMGVTLPKRATKYGVYIAVNRELYGLFGVKYQVSAGAKSGFHRLVREPKLTPLLVSRNFCINPGFVEHWFKAPVAQMACPKAETRRELSEPVLLRRGVTCGFVLKEGVAAYSRLVAGARRVYRMGLWLTLCTGLLSMALMIQTIAALVTGGAMISAGRLLILNLILWILVEVWARVALRK